MHQAKKSLGQNFLKDKAILEAIIEAAELSSEDHVLEVGPGKGALTDQILEKAGKLTVIEIDDDLIPLLEEKYGTHPKFNLIHGDALEVSPPKGAYKIVANLPYYITSPLINHFLLKQFLGQQNKNPDANPPTEMVIMVQKEVAEKILAQGKKGQKHSVLSLQVHCFGTPELVVIAPKEAFDPAPKVDSAVIKIKVDPNKLPKEVDLKKLFWLFKIGFTQKRKKLANNLKSVFNEKPNQIKERLKTLNIDPETRAEDLNLEEWLTLLKALS